MKWFYILTLPLFLLDYLTKEWTVRRFPFENSEEIVVIDQFFSLVRVHNRGVAFGMANQAEYANYIFGAISLGALLFIVIAAKKNVFPSTLSKISICLIVSGIFGNGLDRLLRGYVVDFLSFNLKFMQWPAFNVADSCICVGALLLFLTSFEKTPTQAKSN